MAELRYTAVHVYTKPLVSGSWTKHGDLVGGVRVRYDEHIEVENTDESGKTAVQGVYKGAEGDVSGVFKTFDDDTIAALYHGVDISGTMKIYGQNKHAGALVSGFKLALKPVDSTDTRGTYIPKAINTRAMDNPLSTASGQHEQMPFAFTIIRLGNDVSNPLIYTEAVASNLPDFPT